MKTFNNKSAFKKLVCCVFCSVFTFLAVFSLPSPTAKASVLDDLQKKYDQLEKSIKKNQDKLSDAQDEIISSENQLDTINQQIDDIQAQIELLNTKISALNESINTLRPQINELNSQIKQVTEKVAELERNITAAEESVKETKNSLLIRIREDYMSGGGASTLEILLTSKDLSSFFSRMELLKRLSDNDSKLIHELEEHAKELSKLKEEANAQKAELQLKKSQLDSKMATLNSNMDDLQTSKEEQEYKQNSLNNKYEQVNELIDELDKDSAAYRKEISRQRQQMEVLSKQIDELIKQKGSSQGDEVPEDYTVNRTSNGLIWPVPYNNTYISCHYGYYSDGSRHWGTDIVIRDSNGNNISNGKDIVAAQSGKVILAVNDGNYNYGYGNYCIIDHGNGMMTLYCHCKRIVVYENQIVSQGQKIAEIGLTGNTTGYHLHFEVRIKNADGSVSRVNPEYYVSKP